MAIQGYIGWPTDVNRIIIDSSTFTLGENAVKSDELESGLKNTVMKGGYAPDRYNVTMSFNWVDVIPGRGRTEFELFTEWYKYRHKFGSVPFEFPKLLYSSNTGIKIYDTVDKREGLVEYYKITSSVPGKKSGDEIEINMTWETVYAGTVSIDTPLPEIVGIQATTKYVDVFFSAVSDTAPVHDQFNVYIDDSLVTMSGFCYDGSKTVRIYYPERSHGSVTITANYSGLIVPAGEFTSTF